MAVIQAIYQLVTNSTSSHSIENKSCICIHLNFGYKMSTNSASTQLIFMTADWPNGKALDYESRDCVSSHND